jgi:hypothetical protein
VATSTVYTTPNLDVVQYPQGYDRSGFADSDMALAAHGRALKRESFEGTYTARSDRGTLEITVKADPDTRRVHKVLVVNDSVSSELFYDAGEVTTRQPGEQGFSSDVPTYVAAAYIEGELDWFSYSALSDPQVHRQAGRTVISYYVTSTRADRDHEGELIVTETGLVLQFSLRVETDQETFFVEHRLTDLGETTVDTPGWVDDTES